VFLFSCNLLKWDHIGFKRAFQIDYTIIFSLASSLPRLPIYNTKHLKSYANLRMNALIFVHSVILPFHIASNVFPYALCTKLDLPHPLILRVIHCIGDQTLDLTMNHLLLFPWWRMNCIPWCHLKCLCLHREKHRASCFKWANLCPSTTSLKSFRRWVNIVLSTNDIYTLANVVIINPTQQIWFLVLPHLIGWLWQWWFK